MMKRYACGALTVMAATLGSTAMAQQVVIYGIVDSGVEYVDNANAAGKSVVRVPSSTSSFPSRIGFKGSEDLGGGLQAVFALETRLALDSGTVGQGNRLFGRQAWVGLKSAAGTVMLGRQVNMTYMAALKSDVLGPHLFSINSLDGYLPNARSDNAIGYFGTFSNISLGATYSVGRDTSAAGGPSATGCAGEVAGDSKACRQVTALLGYDNQTYGATLAYDILYGGPGAANGLTDSQYSDVRVSLNGYARIGQQFKLGLGLIERKIEAATDSRIGLYYLGGTYTFTSPWIVDAQLSQLKIKDSDKKSTLSVLRATYMLSKRTALHASLGHISNAGGAAVAVDAGGTVGAGTTQNGVLLGLRHAF